MSPNPMYVIQKPTRIVRPYSQHLLDRGDYIPWYGDVKKLDTTGRDMSFDSEVVAVQKPVVSAVKSATEAPDGDEAPPMPEDRTAQLELMTFAKLKKHGKAEPLNLKFASKAKKTDVIRMIIEAEEALEAQEVPGAEETPAEETPAEETPAEETSAEEAPAEEEKTS